MANEKVQMKMSLNTENYLKICLQNRSHIPHSTVNCMTTAVFIFTRGLEGISLERVKQKVSGAGDTRDTSIPNITLKIWRLNQCLHTKCRAILPSSLIQIPELWKTGLYPAGKGLEFSLGKVTSPKEETKDAEHQKFSEKARPPVVRSTIDKHHPNTHTWSGFQCPLLKKKPKQLRITRQTNKQTA